MKAESWIFAICTVFFVLVTPAYWLIARDPTGTSALVMTALLTLLVTFYLGFHASKMEPRPEETLITRGVMLVRRRGMATEVSRATEVMFVSKVEL